MWFHLHDAARMGKFMEASDRTEVPRGWGGGSGEDVFGRQGASVWGGEKCPRAGGGGGVVA